jgi:hypothetical protein
MPPRINPVDASSNTRRSQRNGISQPNYAQMENPWRRPRSRSASPASANSNRPYRERSPLPSDSQDMITPPEPTSNTPHRIPDIMKKTWEKPSRSGARTRWSPVYEHYENIDLVGEVYYKREDKARKTPYGDVLRICTHC